jgi:hypothetical protein
MFLSLELRRHLTEEFPIEMILCLSWHHTLTRYQLHRFRITAGACALDSGDQGGSRSHWLANI